MKSARNMIGAGARKLIERGLELEGRMMSVEDVNRLMKNFIDYYAAHIADASRPFEGLEAALDQLAAQGCRFAVCTTSWMAVKQLLDHSAWRRFSASAAPTRSHSPSRPHHPTATVARAGGDMATTIMVSNAGPTSASQGGPQSRDRVDSATPMWQSPN